MFQQVWAPEINIQPLIIAVTNGLRSSTPLGEYSNSWASVLSSV